MKQLILTLLLLLMMAGCATYGNQITDQMVSGIIVGETTKETIIQQFGKPLSKSVRSDGTEVYAWGYYDANLLSGKSENKAISVIFSDGIATDYTYTDMHHPL